MRPILFDTCAAIWISEGDALGEQADKALSEVDTTAGAVLVSPITAWEIGILAATARSLNCRLMTRDRPLLAYAAAGHLAAIPC